MTQTDSICGWCKSQPVGKGKWLDMPVCDRCYDLLVERDRAMERAMEYSNRVNREIWRRKT